MTDREGGLAAAAALLLLIVIAMWGDRKMTPCDFVEVTSYYVVHSDEKVGC